MIYKIVSDLSAKFRGYSSARDEHHQWIDQTEMHLAMHESVPVPLSDFEKARAGTWVPPVDELEVIPV